MALSREEARQVCDWRQSQAITLGTGCFSLAGLILSPLLTAVLSAAELHTWQIYLFLAGAALAAVSGGLWHAEAGRRRHEYILRAEGKVSW
jgi:MFS family permease